ncbi:MAG: histidine phosphatase family protein [Lachnospiraceae bacterium]|nr:histidine phosphatase family protein [Lachnospiraceae bacterium]
MKFYLIRHGETDWNIQNRIQGQTDTLLNERGREQAHELAERLKDGYEINTIYTSRQKRARETAEVIGEAIQVTPIVREGLEEISLGIWEGYTWKQVREQFRDEYQAWYVNRRYEVPPGGESYQQLLDRLLPVLADIFAQNPENVLIVTHSAVIMTLLTYLYDTPFEDMAKNYKTGNTGIVEIDQNLFHRRYIK